MKYSHRKAQMEANRLKNLANPNFEKKQVKYDREKKKRDEKRNLRMQAIINGMEIDMSYMKGMSNRQRKKEEARIREAKSIREERLAAMGLGKENASRESSPPSSEDGAPSENGGVKLNGDKTGPEDITSTTDQQVGKTNEPDSEPRNQTKLGNKRKNAATVQPEDEKKGIKKQKKAAAKDSSEESTKVQIKSRIGKEQKSERVVKLAQVPAASSDEAEDELEEGEGSAASDEVDEIENGEVDLTVDASRLDDSDSSDSDEEGDENVIIADAVNDATQAQLEDQEGRASENAEVEGDIPLSDLDSLASDEKGDIIPHQRLSINNRGALEKAWKSIALPYLKLQFSDHMTTTTAEPVQVTDINDDLERELAFYRQCLDGVNEARRKLKKENVPFSRPADYFAEMVKSDEHMGKIKQKLVDEAAGKKAAAEARKQRDLKKFGKQVQIAKQQERAKEKRDTMEKISVLKRKRQNAGLDAADESELFDVALEDAAETDKKERAARKAAAAGKPNAKRQKKDEKYGFGGKKRHSKDNDAKSTNDMSGFSTKKMKGKEKKHRPGKSKRANARN
ncbi:MAG: hypothetical protein Q9165_000934 [Trypethelium subeluteriae]